MGLGKRLLTNRQVISVLAGVVAGYLKLVVRTSRVTIENKPLLDRLADTGEPAIGVFWHGRMMLMPQLFHRFVDGKMLISAHRDGEIIAQVIHRLGFETIRGSSARIRDGKTKGKGGMAALLAMIKTVKDGGQVAITPDGPRGPRMRASPGVITLAAETGAPLVCAAWSGSRVIQFNSWDRLLLPLPFGHIVMAVSQPITVGPKLDEADFEARRRQVEDTLNALCRDCDMRVGRQSTAPAALPNDAPAI